MSVRWSNGRTKRSSASLRATSPAWVLRSIAPCCAISVAVQSAPSARNSPSSRPSLAIGRGPIIMEHGTHMRHGQLGRAPFDLTGLQGPMGDRQILADQCKWGRVFIEVAEHDLLRPDDLRIGPIIADAVTETVLQV